MKSKDLKIGQLIAWGSKASLKEGVLSQGMVIGLGFDLEYVMGQPIAKVDPKRVLLLIPMKDQGYPDLVLGILRQNEDPFVVISQILNLEIELRKKSFLISSISLPQIQMPWEVWMKERFQILKERKKELEQELQEDLRTEKKYKKRYDRVKDQLRNLGIDTDFPSSCPKRFMVSLTLDQAEELIQILNKLKQRVSLN